MKNKVKELKVLIMVKNVSMEVAIEELVRIQNLCSNCVQDDILNVIEELQRGINVNYQTL